MQTGTGRMSEPLVTPKPGQSLGGLVIEGAGALGERTIRGLLADAGTSLLGLVHHRATADQLAAVADGMDLEPEALVSRCHGLLPGGDHRRSYFGVSMDCRMLQKRTRRFAPASLRDEPWHRAAWQLRPLPFCERSWTLVTDTCHSCGVRQRWSRAWGTELCDVCATPLCEGSTPAVPLSLQPSLRYAGGLLHHEAARRSESIDALPERLRPLGASGCFDVLCAVAGVVDPSIRASDHPQLPSDSSDPSRTTVAIARAWELLTGWPDAVLGHCDAELARRTGRHGDGNAGASATLLTLDGRNGISQPLSVAVGQLRATLVERQPGHVDAREFTRISGIAPRNVARLRRGGCIRSIVGLTETGGVVPLLPVSAALRSRSSARGSLTAEQAAMRIGCTYRGVEELIQMGVLSRSEPSVRDCMSARLRIEASSLDGMFESLSGLCTSPLDGSFELPLNRALWALGGRLKPWSAILRALSDGRLQFALLPGTKPLSERIRLRSEDARQLNDFVSAFADADPRFDPLMSKTDAFAVLNTEARFAPELSARLRTSKGWERTVPSADVIALASRLISLREVAVLSGTTTSAAAKNLVRHGRVPLVDMFHDRVSTLDILGLGQAPDHRQGFPKSRTAPPTRESFEDFLWIGDLGKFLDDTIDK